VQGKPKVNEVATSSWIIHITIDDGGTTCRTPVATSRLDE
jgi:hypothetical protein